MPGTRKLGRTSDHRKAMLRAMVTYLLENGRIETTVTRAKDIGAMACVLNGKVDQIVITGGIAYGEDVVAKLKERCGWIAPVTVYPGEDELLALAQGALRVMNGEEQVKQY